MCLKTNTRNWQSADVCFNWILLTDYFRMIVYRFFDILFNCCIQISGVFFNIYFVYTIFLVHTLFDASFGLWGCLATVATFLRDWRSVLELKLDPSAKCTITDFLGTKKYRMMLATVATFLRDEWPVRELKILGWDKSF